MNARPCEHEWNSRAPAWDGSEGGESVSTCVHCHRHFEDVALDEEMERRPTKIDPIMRDYLVRELDDLSLLISGGKVADAKRSVRWLATLIKDLPDQTEMGR